jgi:hypothetical protein
MAQVKTVAENLKSNPVQLPDNVASTFGVTVTAVTVSSVEVTSASTTSLGGSALLSFTDSRKQSPFLTLLMAFLYSTCFFWRC